MILNTNIVNTSGTLLKVGDPVIIDESPIILYLTYDNLFNDNKATYLTITHQDKKTNSSILYSYSRINISPLTSLHSPVCFLKYNKKYYVIYADSINILGAIQHNKWKFYKGKNMDYVTCEDAISWLVQMKLEGAKEVNYYEKF